MKKVLLDGKYVLGGGMGSWAKSFERAVGVGDVRYIGGRLMYAYAVRPRGWFRKSEVNWCPATGENWPKDLRDWMEKL